MIVSAFARKNPLFKNPPWREDKLTDVTTMWWAILREKICRSSIQATESWSAFVPLINSGCISWKNPSLISLIRPFLNVQSFDLEDSKPNWCVVKIGKSYARYMYGCIVFVLPGYYSFSSISWLSAPNRVDLSSSCSSTSGSSMFGRWRLDALRCT